MNNFLNVGMRYTVWRSDFDKFTTLRDLEKHYQSVMAIKEQDIANATENERLHQENCDIFNAVVALAKSGGFKVNSYVTGTRKRSGYYKDEKWVEELRKQLPRPDSSVYDPKKLQKNYEDFESGYQERKKRLEQIERQNAYDREQKYEYAKKSALAIRVAAKYGLPEDMIDRESIIEALESRDKYIVLATAMEATRGDWSDGFYRVEYALDKFTIGCEEDTYIVADILNCMDSDDGRVFRDTTYNYNVLYGMANQELLADLRKLY